MHVLLVNENTLGHGSYLRPFATALEAEPAFGITTGFIDAVPLSGRFARLGDTSIRGLRRWSLDFHAARWRWAASLQVRERVREYRRQQRVDAVVVNTQSVGLAMREVAREMPLFVAADATFAQLRRTGWFGTSSLTRALHPLTLLNLRSAERRLYHAAAGILAWSEPVRRSLVEEYDVPESRVTLLPPSVAIPSDVAPQPRNARPRLLFIGGDFRRKGGRVLLDAYHGGLAERCELDIVTQSPVAPSPGVRVHHGVQWGAPKWRQLWDAADVFVFPSRMETFGIVLIEALSFGVPVVSSAVGAARDILDDGRAGTLVDSDSPEALRRAIASVLDMPSDARRARVAAGRERALQRYELSRNTARLATLLRGAHPLPSASAGAALTRTAPNRR